MPPAAPVRRARRLARRALVVVVVVAAIGGGAYFGWAQWFQSGPVEDIQLYEVVRKSFPIILEEKGELKATNSVDVKNEVEGRATIISLADEGTHVAKGDLLVELASDEIEEKIEELKIKVAVEEAALQKAETDLEILRDENASKIRKAELALEMAEISLKKYEEGDAFELQKDAEINREQAEFELNRAREYLKDSEDLFKQGFITQIERDDDRFTEYKADNQLTKSGIKLDVLKKYTIPMDLKEKQSDVEEAGAELKRAGKAAEASEEQARVQLKAEKDQLEIVRGKLDKALEQKKKTKIYAPAEGLVVYFKEGWWRRESEIKTGVEVHERQTLIELPDTSSMKVEVNVHEAQIERLEEGLSATITVEGLQGRQFTGKVTKIAVLADSQHRWLNPNLKQFKTEVQIDGEVNELKPGATARVQITITELQDVIAIPVQAVFGKGGKYYVFLDEKGNPQPVEVEVGPSSNEYIEITEGLQVGQKIRLAVTEDMKLELPDRDDGERERGGKGAKGRRGG